MGINTKGAGRSRLNVNSVRKVFLQIRRVLNIFIRVLTPFIVDPNAKLRLILIRSDREKQ